jgi:hypothetical protein
MKMPDKPMRKSEVADMVSDIVSFSRTSNYADMRLVSASIVACNPFDE